MRYNGEWSLTKLETYVNKCNILFQWNILARRLVQYNVPKLSTKLMQNTDRISPTTNVSSTAGTSLITHGGVVI